MADFKQRSVLTGIKVSEAMSRNVCRLTTGAALSDCIRHMTRCKEDAVLLEDPDKHSVGVISRTDIIGAYYSGLPLASRTGDIMNPALFCSGSDRIEQVLAQMGEQAVHRVYVKEKGANICGMISFTDIVGLLYRYCRSCRKSRRRAGEIESMGLPKIRIRDVMTDHVFSCLLDDTIGDAIELLLCAGTGAVLVVDADAVPVGVVSKADVNRAYFQGQTVDEPVRSVMTSPVVSCTPDDDLVDVLQNMFLYDLNRFFVLAEDTGTVLGVISLSDAVRFRSGTCQACSASRVIL